MEIGKERKKKRWIREKKKNVKYKFLLPPTNKPHGITSHPNLIRRAQISDLDLDSNQWWSWKRLTFWLLLLLNKLNKFIVIDKKNKRQTICSKMCAFSNCKFVWLVDGFVTCGRMRHRTRGESKCKVEQKQYKEYQSDEGRKKRIGKAKGEGKLFIGIALAVHRLSTPLS